jgi:hypothetical protein
MRRIALAVFAVCLFFASVRPAAAAAPPYPNAEEWDEPWKFPANPFRDKDPFKAAVIGGKMLWHHREGTHAITQTIPLGGPAKLRPFHEPPAPVPDRPWPPKGVTMTAEVIGFPLRWHATKDAFYIADAWIVSIPCEYLRRYRLDDLVAGKVKSDLLAEPHTGPSSRFTLSCPGNVARLCCGTSNFNAKIFYDYLPAGDTGVRQFVLTNARGEAHFGGKGDLVARLRIVQSEEERTNPKWSFTVHRCDSKWDKKDREWDTGPWSKEEKLPVVFKEHFHALQKGDDYFFLTASGKLFVSPKPAKGKKRTIKAVHDDAKRPIQGVIVAPKEGKTHLFVESAKGPAFFELSDKPKLQVYDPRKAKVPEGEAPLRHIMHKARVLVALGKLKGK